MSVPQRYVGLGAYAIATLLAFPHPIAPLGGAVLDLGAWVSWAVAPLLWLALRDLPPGRSARLAFLGGWLAHWALFHWIYVVTVRYGNASPAVGVLAPAALALYPAAALAGFGAASSLLARRGWSGPWLLALLWTLQDHLRNFALSGFPWGVLGYAQHRNPLLLAVAPYTGVYGLSFLTVLGGGAALHLLWARHGGRTAAWAARLALGTALAAPGAAWILREAGDDPGGETLRVAVLQGNIDQGVKWSRAHAQETLEAYEDLSRRAGQRGAEVILWPETAVPGSISTDPPLRERLADLARELSATLVVGAVGIERRRGEWHYFDSAFVFDEQGRLRDRYDKAHLVPFGEYLPLRRFLGGFLGAVASGIAPGDVTAGASPRPLALPRSDHFVTVGVPICYELLFPDLVRRFVRDGAVALFAITNDAWYGRTGAPYQFLAMTALRSAENRVWMARAANTGVSAIIDHRGRVRARTAIFERDLLVADVFLRPAPRGGSPYARHGDVFVTGCWVAVVLLSLTRRRARARGEE